MHLEARVLLPQLFALTWVVACGGSDSALTSTTRHPDGGGVDSSATGGATSGATGGGSSSDGGSGNGGSAGSGNGGSAGSSKGGASGSGNGGSSGTGVTYASAGGTAGGGAGGNGSGGRAAGGTGGRGAAGAGAGGRAAGGAGGRAAGGTGAGGLGAGGSTGDPCKTLGQCCKTVQAALRPSCNQYATLGMPVQCNALLGLYCATTDGGPVVLPPDAGNACTTLAACCPKLGPQQAQCESVVSAGVPFACGVFQSSLCP